MKKFDLTGGWKSFCVTKTNKSYLSFHLVIAYSALNYLKCSQKVWRNEKFLHGGTLYLDQGKDSNGKGKWMAEN